MNNETKWQALMTRWHRLLKTKPQWRKGQALMNALHATDYDLSSVIIAEGVHDCFYDDASVGETLSYIANQYNIVEGR